MNAQALMLSLLIVFVNCFTRHSPGPVFTKPGFEHFQTFIIAHAALFGLQHCVTEVMRLTRVHAIMHWTTPYAFLRKGWWSCKKVSQCLLDLVAERLKIMDVIGADIAPGQVIVTDG